MSKFYFSLFASFLLFQINIIAQNYLYADSVNILLDVYRRSSDYYSHPNAFVRVDRAQGRNLKMNLAFIKDDSIHLEIETNRYANGSFSLGRNHIKSKELNLWDASYPFIYDLQITLFDSLEVYLKKSIPVGIVDYRMKKGNLLVNNKEQILNGKYLSKELSVQDVLKIREEFVNTLVFDFIPSYESVMLCSRFGIYVIINLGNTFDPNRELKKIRKIINLPAVSYFVLQNTEQMKTFNKLFYHKITNKKLPNNLSLYTFKDGYSWEDLTKCIQAFHLNSYVNKYGKFCECGLDIFVKDSLKD